MGQKEVLEWLTEQRRHTDKFFTCSEIKKGMENNGGNTNGLYSDLFRLCYFLAVEFRGVGIWSHKKEFRALKITGRAKKSIKK